MESSSDSLDRIVLNVFVHFNTCRVGSPSMINGSVNPMNFGESSLPDKISIEFHSLETANTLGDLRKCIGNIYNSCYNQFELDSEFKISKSRLKHIKVNQSECDNQVVIQPKQPVFMKNVDTYIENKMCFVLFNKECTSLPSLEAKHQFADHLENWLNSDSISLQQLMLLSTSMSPPTQMSLTNESITTLSNTFSVFAPKSAIMPKKHINLLLLPMVDMPSPTITATIVSIKKVLDGIVLLNINNKSYVQYNLIVRQSRLEWPISRRFSGK